MEILEGGTCCFVYGMWKFWLNAVGELMPVVSPFYLLIGGGLIGVDVIPLASKLIFAVYLYTKDT
ncbi:hypothetical protein JD793_002769 [Citrobacter braakii]|nr:hypothetical protein [Citrobacter braakii]